MTKAGDTSGPWRDEAILRESGRWTHVPRGGALVEDGRRFLVHLPEPGGTSRVWRSRAANEGEAEALILDTLEEVRAAGKTRLIWHTGPPMAPPFMDDLLLNHGFRVSEELVVLAFELGDAPEPELPRLGDTARVSVRIARDAEDLRRSLRVESEVFSNPAPSEQAVSEFVRELERLERREEDPVTTPEPAAFRSLAFAGDIAGDDAIASAGAQVAGKTLRLWGAGTLKPYRGLGAYRALVVERCRAGHALGATLALTKANASTSAPTLKAAGFKPVARERRLVFDTGP